MYKYFFHIYILFFVFVFDACRNVGEKVDYGEEIYKKSQADSIYGLIVSKHDVSERNIRLFSRYCIGQENYEELFALLNPLFLEGMENDNHALVVYSGAFIATAYLELDNIDSVSHYVRYLLKADSLMASENKHYSGMIHNLAAISCVRRSLDYTTALHHYQIALEATKAQKDSNSNAIVLANIARIYSLRQDTSGLKYLREAMNLFTPPPYTKNADEVNELERRLLILMGEQYLLRGMTDSADFYLTIALGVEGEDALGKNNSLFANMLAGKVCHKKGEYAKAEEHFKIALSFIQDMQGKSGYDIQTLCGYGDLKRDMLDYGTAMYYYRKGLEFAENNHNIEYLYNIWGKMSGLYESMNRKDSALVYYKRYMAAYTESFTHDKEKEFYKLKELYDKLYMEEQMQKMELQLVRSKQKYDVFIFISVVLAIVAFSSIAFYRKERNTRRKLLGQYYVFKERIDEYRQKDCFNGESDAAMSEIFDKLEALMCEKIYHNPDLSLDKVAEMLQVNSLMLSKVIKEFRSTTFPQYVNRYRIQEAVEILSDVNRQDLVKSVAILVGYSTFSTFYRAFIKETGLSPTNFRTEIFKQNKWAIDK